jgi:hypothetical protein
MCDHLRRFFIELVDLGQQLWATSFLLHDFVRCAGTLFSNVWGDMDTKEIDRCIHLSRH